MTNLHRVAHITRLSCVLLLIAGILLYKELTASRHFEVCGWCIYWFQQKLAGVDFKSKINGSQYFSSIGCIYFFHTVPSSIRRLLCLVYLGDCFISSVLHLTSTDYKFSLLCLRAVRALFISFIDYIVTNAGAALLGA